MSISLLESNVKHLCIAVTSDYFQSAVNFGQMTDYIAT